MPTESKRNPRRVPSSSTSTKALYLYPRPMQHEILATFAYCRSWNSHALDLGLSRFRWSTFLCRAWTIIRADPNTWMRPRPKGSTTTRSQGAGQCRSLRGGLIGFHARRAVSKLGCDNVLKSIGVAWSGYTGSELLPAVPHRQGGKKCGSSCEIEHTQHLSFFWPESSGLQTRCDKALVRRIRGAAAAACLPQPASADHVYRCSSTWRDE